MFANLDVRTCFSILRSSLKVESYLDLVSKDNQQYAGIADLNVLHGAYYFYKECIKRKIKPIIGMEINFNNDRILLFAKNYIGYQNLVLISTLINQGKNIESSMLSDDIIKISTIPTSGFYVYDEIAISQVRYASKKNELSYLAVNAIRENKFINPHQFSNEDFCFVSQSQAAIRFSQSQLDQLDKILNQIDLVWPSPKFRMPTYQSNSPHLDKISSPTLLAKTCEESLNNKFNGKIPEVYKSRLELELQTIVKMNFSNYFLVVADFINYARRNQILVGPGRGSAPGSVMCYLLGISEIDPVENNLLFERFLNPERKTMPDIDVDVMDTRRSDVITYIYEKYGTNNACHILTYQKFKLKLAIRDLGRIFSLPTSDIDEMSKAVPYETDTDIDSSLSVSKTLAGFNEKYPFLFATAKELIDCPRNYSVHPAGILIADSGLGKEVPLLTGENEMMTTQFEAEELEELGYVKIDILGLKNLTIISNILNLIKLRKGVSIDLLNIPLNEAKTLASLGEGKTNGIFQLESPGMRSLLKKINVKEFEDIVLTTSLYRPGPQDYINPLIARKKSHEKTSYLSEVVSKILEPTYDVMVYQEQVILMAKEVGGISLAQADNLRRAISKKNLDQIEQFKNSFEKNDSKLYSFEYRMKVFADIMKFAGYGFNRSHAYAYSLISYRMAYLKTNYPLEFLVCLLSQFTGDSLKVENYLSEAIENGVTIQSWSVTESEWDFTIKNNKLVLSLSLIKDFGFAAWQKLFEERNKHKFVDAVDAIVRIKNAGISERVISNLIDCGSFDEFKVERSALKANLKSLIQYSELVKVGNGTDFNLFPKPELVNPEDTSANYDDLQFKVTGLRLMLKKPIQLQEQVSSEEVQIIKGTVLSLTTRQQKNGQQMAMLKFKLEDDTTKQAIIFANYWRKLETSLKEGDFCEFKIKSYLGKTDYLAGVKKILT